MSETHSADSSPIRVVQCWDDGVSDDIRVIEILRKHGAKASFNLNAGLHGPTRRSGWRFKDVKDVYRLSLPELVSVYEGFVVANHSLTHPHLDQISLADATREIVDGRDALDQLFGYAIKGFVYPFGTHDGGVRDAVENAGHVYARTVANVKDAFPPSDPMQFHPNCHFMNPKFWDIFEGASTSGVFYFWGHSYEMVTEEQWLEFETKIARLSANPRVVWFDLPDLF